MAIEDYWAGPNRLRYALRRRRLRTFTGILLFILFDFESAVYHDTRILFVGQDYVLIMY